MRSCGTPRFAKRSGRSQFCIDDLCECVERECACKENTIDAEGAAASSFDGARQIAIRGQLRAVVWLLEFASQSLAVNVLERGPIAEVGFGGVTFFGDVAHEAPERGIRQDGIVYESAGDQAENSSEWVNLPVAPADPSLAPSQSARVDTELFRRVIPAWLDTYNQRAIAIALVTHELGAIIYDTNSGRRAFTLGDDKYGLTRVKRVLMAEVAHGDTARQWWDSLRAAKRALLKPTAQP